MEQTTSEWNVDFWNINTLQAFKFVLHWYEIYYKAKALKKHLFRQLEDALWFVVDI